MDLDDLLLLEDLLLDEGVEPALALATIPRRQAAEAPASFQQRRLWFLHQLEPSSAAYNIATALRLDGPLNRAAFQQAFTALAQRHEILRTRFENRDGQPWQIISAAAEIPVHWDDWTQQAGQDLAAIIKQESQFAFDLAAGPLFRVRVLQLAEREHVFLLTMHHIIADGWSLGIFIGELLQCYTAFLAGQSPRLPELRIQYADYAYWQQAALDDSGLAAQLAYWEAQLQDLPVLNFPTDLPRPKMQTFKGDLCTFLLSQPVSQGLKALSQQGGTLFMSLSAAFFVLLSRFTRQQDFAIGTSIAQRNDADTQALIGFFVNMLVLRADLSGAPSFLELLERVKKTVLDAFDHADVPYENLVERLQPVREQGRNPLFQIAFTLLNAPAPAIDLGELKVQTLANQNAARFDLELFIHEGPDGLDGVFSYNTDLFKADTIARLARHFNVLLESIVADPSQPIARLPLLDEAERSALSQPSARKSFPVTACLHQRFAEQAAKYPERTALRFNGRSMSYRELDARANALAQRLAGLGVGPEVLVGLWAERSLETLVGLLAILKAGGAYVPLDPTYPPDRVAFMLDDSRVPVIVTTPNLLDKLPPHQAQTLVFSLDEPVTDAAAPDTGVKPADAAYVIYTSGSTGRPKGVVVTHANAVRLMDATNAWYRFNQRDVWTLFHSYAFDFSVWEIWGALLYGGKLVVVPYEVSRSPEEFYHLLCDERVTVLNQTPSAFRQLIQAERRLGREADIVLRYVVFGGEALDLAMLEPWMDRHGDDAPRLINMYGITETTVHVTYRPIRLGDVKRRLGSVIGEPIPDLEIHLLDETLQPVPLGAVGEIFVGGDGLARGYLNRPELTAERFIQHPFLSDLKERLYRSGDLARRLVNGDLEFHGRADDQVKIRGFRVELPEIEAVLVEFDGVAQALAIVREDQPGDQRLVAYVVPNFNAARENNERDWIEQWGHTFEETYGQPPEREDETFNIVGWNSSYAEGLIPPEEMREWLDDTIDRIRALQPRKVLEIGCGTGMLLYRIAAEAEQYWATDFSANVLAEVQAEVDRRGWQQAKLFRREGIAFDGLPTAAFDTVIINSVIQYFPSLDYLLAVLDGVFRCLAPGGKVFLGDLRSLPLLKAFHASTELFKAADSLSRDELRHRVNRSFDRDEELILDPLLFPALQQRYPQIYQIEAQLKPARARNELSLFRYDVTLRTADDLDLFSPDWRDWQREPLSLAELRQGLEAGETVAIKNIANPRLWEEIQCLQWLEGTEGTPTVGVFRRGVEDEAAAQGLNPADLAALSQEFGYQLVIDWSPGADDGRYDACFHKTGGLPLTPLARHPAQAKDLAVYANDTSRGRFLARLIPALRRHAADKLPNYMVPAAFVTLERLPLTPSGKLNRAALPPPEAVRSEAEQSFVPPSSEVERKLCELWAEVLGLHQVGRDDDFFALGGHSLLATQLISRVRNAFRIEIPLRIVFNHSTVAALAAEIEKTAGSQTEAGDQEPALQAVPRSGPLPLSFSQQRLWFLDLLEPGNPAYNIPLALRLEGELNIAALRDSFDAIIQRHESLRTIFPAGGEEPSQIILDSARFELQEHDWAGLAAAEQTARLAPFIQAEARQPFDLQQGPLMRGVLIRLAPDRQVLLLLLHHIVSDGWSLGVLVKEMKQLYEAHARSQTPALPALPVQYADFAHWQRQRDLSAQRDYWVRQLTGLGVKETLPVDYRRPAQSSALGACHRFHIPQTSYQALQAFSLAHEATLFMTLLAVFAALLNRCGGNGDIAIGTPVANRNRAEIEGLIGFFVNVLVMRVDANDDPRFGDLLGRVKDTALDAYAHQDYPFELIVEALQPERDRARHPLFQVMFVLQNAPGEKLQLPGLTIDSLPIETGISKFDLSLLLEESPDGIAAVLEYDAELFAAATIQHLAERLQTVCAHINNASGQRLSALPLLADEEKALLEAWSKGPVYDYERGRNVPTLIAQHAQVNPAAAAVAQAGQTLDYAELERRAVRLAGELRRLGVAPDEIVGLCVERSADMVVGMLAIMRVGAAYLPLDPAYPTDRLAFMLEDSGAKLVLTQAEALDRLPVSDLNIVLIEEAIAQATEQLSLPAVAGDPLAYIIYTSGSTGVPKGVPIRQSNLLHSTLARVGYYQEAPQRFLLLSSFSFDSSVAGIFWTLSQGGALVLPPPGVERDVPKLLQLIQAESVTHLLTIPSLYALLLDMAEPDGLQSLRTVIVAGEVCPDGLLARHRERVPQAYFCNEYGPTEATVWCTAQTIVPDEPLRPVTIGKPIPNTDILILDQAGQPAPIGCEGELYVGGPGLAEGYLNREALSAERFVPHPLQAGAKLYRTGDLARWLPDGEIAFLGRIDQQIKINGFRIEPGEIEAVLAHYEPISEAVVGVPEDAAGRRQLVAYAVARAGASLDGRELLASLRERLPAHLVPGVCVLLPALPRLPNGKVDRDALPAPDSEQTAQAKVPPRDPQEFQLAEIWAEVLERTDIGVTDDFFELGGHSLLAIKLMARMQKHCACEIPLAALFQGPTIERLAEVIRTGRGLDAYSTLVPLRESGQQPPLFFVHQAGGNVMAYLNLAKHLPADQPFYGIQSLGLDGKQTPLASIEAMATHYADAIRARQPHGPYHIGGHSLGGPVAFELARRLEALGETVGLLAIVDVPAPGSAGNDAEQPATEDAEDLAHIVSQIEQHYGTTLQMRREDLAGLDETARFDLIISRMAEGHLLPPNASGDALRGLLKVYQANMRAILAYRPEDTCTADIALLLSAALRNEAGNDSSLGWAKLTTGRVTAYPVPGDHFSLLQEPHAQTVAAQLAVLLNEVSTRQSL